MTWDDEIWEAAEFETEWHGDGLTYKLYRIPREVLEEHSDADDAWMLHGLDSGTIRRVDYLLDQEEYEIGEQAREATRDAMKSAPEWVRDELSYVTEERITATYKINQRRYWNGADETVEELQDDETNDGWRGTRAEARARILEIEGGTYRLSHNESGWPTHTIALAGE